MSELSRDEVVEILGPVGDAMAAEIIATGISKEGLVAAHDRVVRDRKAHNPGAELDPGAYRQGGRHSGAIARASGRGRLDARMSKQWSRTLIPPNWPPDIVCQVKTRRGFLRAGPFTQRNDVALAPSPLPVHPRSLAPSASTISV